MLEEHERKKYEKVWESQDYRRSASPGELVLKRLPFFAWLKEFDIKSILDCGCGEGRLISNVKKQCPEISVSGIDIAENAIHPGLKDVFKSGYLWDEGLYGDGHDLITCTDVLEHIPTDHVMDVLNIFRKYANKAVFLSICLVDDVFGKKLVGEPLHLTVESFRWWQEKLWILGFETVYGMIQPNVFDCLLVKK